MEMARRPSEVVIYALTLKTIDVLLVGEALTMACVWRRELVVASMDIHTRVDTIRPQILMWDLKNRRKVALAKGQP